MLKKRANCVKSLRNFPQIAACFDADSAVFCVKSQSMLCQKPK